MGCHRPIAGAIEPRIVGVFAEKSGNSLTLSNILLTPIRATNLTISEAQLACAGVEEVSPWRWRVQSLRSNEHLDLNNKDATRGGHYY